MCVVLLRGLGARRRCAISIWSVPFCFVGLFGGFFEDTMTVGMCVCFFFQGGFL